nr:hypothetical protein [uncultured Allomuricauda sp.]
MKTSKFKLFRGMPVIFGILFLMLSSCTDDFIGKISKKATVETVVANFPGSDGVSIDRRGNVLVSNFGNFFGTEVLRAMPRKGSFEVAVDSVAAPTGNAVDRHGNIFVVNNLRFTAADDGTTEADVLKVSPDGTRTVLATLPGFPSGLTLDRHGNAYVSNFNLGLVYKVSPSGEATVFAEDARLAGSVGIDFDNKGNLYVGNFVSGQILKIAYGGDISVLATLPTVVDDFVLGYLTHFAGSLFVTAIGENVIYRVTLSGDISVFAGNGQLATADGVLEEASFSNPNGIAVDALRRVIYISEFAPGGSLRAIQLE